MQKILFFLLLFAGISCTQSGSAQTFLNADQTEKMIASDPNVQLVDLRTPAELQQTGRIAGAKHINYNAPNFKTAIAQLDKNKPVLLYCAAGGRSGQASQVLVQMGFKKVYDYSGGMNDWLAKGKKTVQ